MDSDPGTPIDFAGAELSKAKQKISVRSVQHSNVDETGDDVDRMESEGDVRFYDCSSSVNGECDVKMDDAKDLATNRGKSLAEDGEEKGISTTVERGGDRSVITKSSGTRTEGKRGDTTEAKVNEEKEVMEERKEQVDEATAGKKKEEGIRSDDDEHKRSIIEGKERFKESNRVTGNEKERESRSKRNLMEEKTPAETEDNTVKCGERIECKQEQNELKVDKRNEPQTKEYNFKQNVRNEDKTGNSGATGSEEIRVETAQTTDKNSGRSESKVDAGTDLGRKENEDPFNGRKDTTEVAEKDRKDRRNEVKEGRKYGEDKLSEDNEEEDQQENGIEKRKVNETEAEETKKILMEGKQDGESGEEKRVDDMNSETGIEGKKIVDREAAGELRKEDDGESREGQQKEIVNVDGNQREEDTVHGGGKAQEETKEFRGEKTEEKDNERKQQEGIATDDKVTEQEADCKEERVSAAELRLEKGQLDEGEGKEGENKAAEDIDKEDCNDGKVKEEPEDIQKVVEVKEEDRKEKEVTKNIRQEGILDGTGERQEKDGKLDEDKENEEKSTEKREEKAKEEDTNDGNNVKEKLKRGESKEGNRQKEEVETGKEAEETGKREEKAKGAEYDKNGEGEEKDRKDSQGFIKRWSLLSQEDEDSTVRRSSIESLWKLGRKLGQGASSALDMDQCDPPTCVSLLRTPSPKIYSSLNRKLKGCDQSWMKGFLEEGGLDALLTSVNAISSRKIQLADAMMLLECVACVKTVMNSKIGLQVITERQEYAEILLAGK